MIAMNPSSPAPSVPLTCHREARSARRGDPSSWIASPPAKRAARNDKLGQRTARWLAGLALMVAVPKCFLCVLAYAGLGAALGLGGPELCGGPAVSSWRRDYQSREATVAITRGTGSPASIKSFTLLAAAPRAGR